MENKRNKFLTVTAAALAVTAVAVAPASAASPFSDVKKAMQTLKPFLHFMQQGLLAGIQMVHSNQIQMSHVDKQQK